MIEKNLDISIDPREDFYCYACGGWQKAHPLAKDYSRFGVFDLLRDQALGQLRSLVEEMGSHPDYKIKDTDAQKIHDIYLLGMDMERRNREGAAPILPVLRRIEESTPETLYDTLAWLHRGAGGGFFGFGIGPDPADADMNILHITESGLLLGDRDYYLVDDERNLEIRKAFHDYVLTILRLAGYSDEDAERMWNSVIEIETEIARHKKTREERRNPMLSHNPMSRQELLEKFPSIGWEKTLHGAGIGEFEKLNVTSLQFITFIDSYLPSLDFRKVRDYLIVTALAEATGTLSDDFMKADFELYGKVMSGQQEMKPLWKRVLAIPNSMFGEAVGRLYTERYFPEANKQSMVALVENLRKSLRHHIETRPWMGEDTKKTALEKLSAMRAKIGYPDKWKDYSGIHVDPSKSYNENILKAAEWVIQDEYAKLGKPVDKDEWFMTPQTVNAYYSPSMNEICFPAAILQPPYFDASATPASNYGAIGVVIGHEMTHGFDDQGRQFDPEGNLRNWWDEEDLRRFNAMADRLVEQFDNVEVAPGVHANGRFTLGENIADQGGLSIALSALEMAEDKKPDTDTLKDFFTSYAQLWASNIRPEEILSRNQTDPHSLERNRVNETLKNLGSFMEAFDIHEGNAMYRAPEERVVIW